MKVKNYLKTAADIRRANRGNVPGVLGMSELMRLAGRNCSRCDGSNRAVCTRNDCPQLVKR